MYSLKQIEKAIESLGVDTTHIGRAMTELSEMLAALDEVHVSGRKNVDTLLGCMMAIEQIIDKEDENA